MPLLLSSPWLTFLEISGGVQPLSCFILGIFRLHHNAIEISFSRWEYFQDSKVCFAKQLLILCPKKFHPKRNESARSLRRMFLILHIKLETSCINTCGLHVSLIVKYLGEGQSRFPKKWRGVMRMVWNSGSQEVWQRPLGSSRVLSSLREDLRVSLASSSVHLCGKLRCVCVCVYSNENDTATD